MYTINKMTRRLALIIALCMGVASQAQTAFYSGVSTVGGGVVNSNPSVLHNLSDGSGSLYIWVTDQERVNQSFALNSISDTSGVIAFTGATVYNPNIIGPVNRWTGVSSGGTSANSVMNFNAVAVTNATGIDPANGVLDDLYDTISDAFLFARLDYNIIGLGTTNLSLSEGSTLIVDGGAQVPFSFGSAQITVVPEPNTILFVSTAAVLWGTSRRRRTSVH